MMLNTMLLVAAMSAVGPVSRGTAVGDAPAKIPSSIEDPVVKDCLISFIDEAQVPGREPGVLVALEAKEGLQVKANGVVGRIDDSQPTMEKRIKQREYESEKEKATNDVNVRFNKASAEVAAAAVAKSEAANKQSPRSVSEVELNKLRLEQKKAELGIEQAELEKRVAVLTSDAKAAEVDAADLGIRRRQITSPIDGMVVKVYRHVGEWVAPGDPVVHIVRVDRLRVEGFLSSADYNPAEIDARAVTVEVALARGRKETFDGKVIFVSPIEEAGNTCRVVADVVNRSERGQWLLPPVRTRR